MNNHYDERQMRERGRAFQYGFFTMVICFAVYMILDVLELCLWETSVGCMICMCAGVTVVVVTCIVRDAYERLNTKPGSVLLIFVIITVCNFFPGIRYWVRGELVINGILTFRAMNLVVGIMGLILFVVYAVKRIVTRQVEE